jgi:4-amino-4-deoxy-L-arabinose transferase-like glycosyltransferase
MKFVKKNSFILIILGIFTLFFFTRFFNILSLPIFTDEAIYVRGAQIAKNDATWRFISLTDGKQPMFVWIAMILMKFINDPLLAGRVVSVIAGFFSVIGIFFLTKELFKNKTIALLASFLYVVYPFALVYDRMALYDSLVSMFIIWSLYFEVLLVRYMRLDLALILGMIIGGGMLTKTNANFAFILLPALLLFIDYKKKQWKKNVGKLFLFSLVALLIANAMYAILRLSPFFHIIEAKNYVFIYPFREWLMLVRYATIPFLILVASSFLVGKKYMKEKLFLLIWFIVPFIATGFFFKQAYPRYILFMTMPLLVLGAYALYNMTFFAKKIWLKVLICVVFLAMFFINDYFIVTDFSKASVPLSDKEQYLSGWPAGVGVKETVAFLTEKSKSEKIYVGTEGTFGLMPYSLEMYFYNNPNVIVKGFWPVTEEVPEEVLIAAETMPTYFVFYQPCPSCPQTGVAPIQWNATPVLQIQKLKKNEYYTLYQIDTR